MPPSKLKRPVNRSRGDGPQYIGCVVAVDTRENGHRRFAEQPKNQRAARARLRPRRLADSLHALGPAPLFHFLYELERGLNLRGSFERYANLPVELIKPCGGDQFTPALQAIGGGRE